MPKLLKPKDAAAVLGLSYEKTVDLIRTGAIPACKIGGTWRVPEDALRRSIEEKVAAHAAAVA